MQFQVKFSGVLPDPISTEIGTAEVAQIRQELGDVTLSIIDQRRRASEVVDALRRKGGSTVTVPVDEQAAQNLDVFAHQATVEVQVVQAVFGRFVVEKVWADTDAEGNVTKAGIREDLDTAAMLQAWIDAGAPGRWSE